MRSLSIVLWVAVAAPVMAQPTQFKRHTINAESTYPACAAFDVDRDGKTDIVSGGFWYRAPDWKPIKIREVEEIRGRFDDYSNLPMDVNGDGWTDLISCNYRSQSIYWVQHPGKASGTWSRHVVDRPGSMETGRLADVDGDGRLDVLPNGTKFAAWWRLEPDEEQPTWVRYDLPEQLAGHGIGIGDIDGDGREDLVGPRGWARAPQNRRKDRWQWMGEFQLDRDCGIPILVWDVDQDGDNDIVWGRGHHIGLYWMEQRGGARRQWIRHTIDTSWSQPHSLDLADMDGDGNVDLVVGKRYMGHDGKDPGEFDPLCIFWYAFDGQTRSWRRHLISLGGDAGTGLDPTVTDIDQDGDMDVIAAGRSGLFLFENVMPQAGSLPMIQPVNYPRHDRLMVLRDKDGQPQEIRQRRDWARRRWQILRGIQRAMGPLPSSHRRVPLEVKTISEEDVGDYVRKSISFQAEPGDRVPAYLLVPKKTGRMPAMLCLHQTVRIGKGSPAGMGDRVTLHYGHELAKRGFVCLIPDYPSFGDYPYKFDEDDYQSGSMKAIWNNIRAIDLLQSLPEVNADRIGCIGHSLGGHHALFTSVFDQRIRAVVTSCGFTAFHHYYEGNLKGWTSARYMPRIRDVYQNDPDRVPFDFYEILGAVAPRPVFVCAPQRDHNFAVEGVRKVEAECRKVYALFDAENKMRFEYPDAAHDFPDAVREAAYEFLAEQLK